MITFFNELLNLYISIFKISFAYQKSYKMELPLKKSVNIAFQNSREQKYRLSHLIF